MLGRLKKTIKYRCAYNYYKFRLNHAVETHSKEIPLINKEWLSGDYGVIESKIIIGNYIRKMVGLSRMLGNFDENGNDIPIGRKKFERKLWDSVRKKYKSQEKVA